MKKVTLLFPGQGSQYVGMAKNLLDFSESKSVLEQSKSALDFDITDLMFNGPEDQLKLTEFTQPAIVTHSVALFERLKTKLSEYNCEISQVLGHSVGEYSALVAAGSLSLKDALKAVNKRGQFMQAATPEGVGSMYAILRVPIEYIEKACEASSNDSEKVMPANYNEPTQTVISGHAPACEKAVEWLKENYDGRQMAMPLKVSAPFHSSLMLPAQQQLKEFLNRIEFKENTFPYIANINAQKYNSGTSADTIKENLISQVSGSVRWAQSISTLNEDELFIEVGPGKVLTGLNKKINKNLKTLTLDTEDSFEKLGDFLSGNL